MRPQRIFVINKKGNRHLSQDYRAYLRNLIGMNYEERREWYLLGVSLTRAREARIVDMIGTYDFLTAPINGNGENA